MCRSRLLKIKTFEIQFYCDGKPSDRMSARVWTWLISPGSYSVPMTAALMTVAAVFSVSLDCDGIGCGTEINWTFY